VGTKVSIAKVGLSVQLPGPGWVNTTPGDYPDTRSERWDNHDKSLVFAVFVFDDHMREGHAGLKSFAEEFAYDFQMTPIGESKDERFQGRRAWRLKAPAWASRKLLALSTGLWSTGWRKKTVYT
jgi:hypothetical protein